MRRKQKSLTILSRAIVVSICLCCVVGISLFAQEATRQGPVSAPGTNEILRQYRFNRTLGMSIHQLTGLLKKTPGEWTIWREYAQGSHLSGLELKGYGFMIINGTVSAINEETVYHSDQLERWPLVMNRETLPWINSDGKEPASKAPENVYHLQFVDQFIVNDDGSNGMPADWRKYNQAIKSIRREWHKRHPGVSVTIHFDCVKPEVEVTSGNSAIDAEALELAKRFLREVPTDYQNIYNVRLE